MTKYEIESFLEDNGVDMVQCSLLGSKIHDLLSTRIRNPLQDREKFWMRNSGLKE